MRDGEGGRNLYAKSTEKLKIVLKLNQASVVIQDFTILSVTSE